MRRRTGFQQTVLLRELKALGYWGEYTILRDYLTALRPVATPEPVIRFENGPPDTG